ncbi:hypothetical protein O0L34_g7965 [Tuta absoluta]|nr:hypothetical protein O0L34_g7965 [Tuta absoluta]
MKLFIISALIAVSAAARLEGLEAATRGASFGGAASNKYLAPFGGPNESDGAGEDENGASDFGVQNGAGGFGGQNGAGKFGARGAPSRFTDAASNKYLPPFGGDKNNLNGNAPAKLQAGPNGGDATSNKYLPPFQGSAGRRNGQYQQQGQFGAQGQPGQFGNQDQFGQGQNGQFGSQGQNGQFGQYNQQQGGFQRGQNKPGSQSQQIPVQDFDEETGYHY